MEALFYPDPDGKGVNPVTLDREDRVIARIGEQVESVTQDFPGSVFYVGAFHGVEPGALELTVEVDRQSAPDAPLSVVTIPDAFTLDPIPRPTSRTSHLTVTWSPSGTTDDMSWRIETQAGIELARGHEEPDVGTLTIPSDRIDPVRQCSTDDCELVFWIERRRSGFVDPAFLGGQAIGSQLRVGTFLLVP